ncbi:uncharacterized protein LOC142632528 [Castanea sativa]|uniref:uncharacterized protein LOC142632528 n=1 Tax=Castanea sativa TaxID=21020 RepID=UPI003F64BC64
MRPFYQLSKKWKGFYWNEDCEKAFQDLKEYLVQAPMLIATEPGEDLFMYLSVSKHAISALLLRNQGVQQPVYYVSKTLVDAEIRYLPLEKLVLALVHATRKLSQYFQAHTIYVLTKYPLQSLLKRSDFTGEIAKWGTRLGSFDIRYRLRSSVKGQVLADFVAEFSPRKQTKVVCHVEVHPWKVFVNGASNAMGARAGIVIITPKGIRLEHSLRLGFRASNNKAEYEALIARLRVILDLGAQEVKVYSNSQLVVNQVQRCFEAKYPPMMEYLQLSNGQAEATNKAIVNRLKKRLEGTKGKWVEELPNILWAYWTTPRRSTGETPFSLTYEAEAVIPAEVNLCSARAASFFPTKNDKLMAKHLDLLEECRELATIRLAEYQQKLAWRYILDVNRREFSTGDLVLQKVVGNTRGTNADKLAPTWEGPYRITTIAGTEAYYLEDLDERPLPRPWNVHNLKKFYH